MRTVNLGELVHDVTIQQLTDGVDGAGAPQESWSTLMTAWMARRTETSGEAFAGDQLSAAIRTQWTMRYAADMDPDLVDVPKARRLVYQGRAYDILAADVMDRQSGIVLRTLAASRVTA